MTENASRTLGAIFELDGEPLEAQWGKVVSGACLEAMRKRMLSAAASAVTPGFWRDASTKLVQAAQSLFDTPLPTVLAKAWNARAELRKFGDPVRYPPGKEVLVALREHELESEHTGKVTVLLDGEPVGTVELTLGLTVHVTAGELGVMDGRVIALYSGEGSIEGTLECGGVKVFEKRSKALEFPGRLSLGEGVAIPFADRSVAVPGAGIPAIGGQGAARPIA